MPCFAPGAVTKAPSSPMPTANANLRLYFGPLLIGIVKDPTLREGTWFGTFELAKHKGVDLRDKRLRRIHQYIEFSADFHHRLNIGASAPAAEWDRYSDVTGTGQWNTVDASGQKSTIQAPAFHTTTDISWEQAPV